MGGVIGSINAPTIGAIIGGLLGGAILTAPGDTPKSDKQKGKDGSIAAAGSPQPDDEDEKVVSVDPKSLFSRQGKNEMTGTSVNKIAKSMSKNGYVGKPITIAKLGNGKFAIVDGHHRVAAAIRAGISNVPANVVNVSRAQSSAYMADVFDAIANGAGKYFSSSRFYR